MSEMVLLVDIDFSLLSEKMSLSNGYTEHEYTYSHKFS